MKERVVLDAPTAARAAAIGILIAVGLTIAFSVLELRGAIVLANPITYVVVGLLYARAVVKKASISFLDAGAGGALAGATAGFLVVAAEALVASVLERLDFPFPKAMLATSANALATDIVAALIVGGALAALGSAWVVLLRTQRISAVQPVGGRVDLPPAPTPPPPVQHIPPGNG
ncbi:MAG: hypothetical protein HOW73_48595 [Polyangiaceae bacterium]|nr:hypothetical protein [Polyangiaceae bacterium]